MAKVGFWLQGSKGKLGGANLSQTAGGATILKTNSHPTNPNTAKQIEARAKFKLMSQIATAFKKVIAIPRNGELSPRNQFFTENYKLVDFGPNPLGNNQAAYLHWTQLQLTKSSLYGGQINYEIEDAHELNIAISGWKDYTNAVIVKVYGDAENEVFSRTEAVTVKLNGGGADLLTNSDNLLGCLVYGYNIDESKLSGVAYDDYAVATSSGSDEANLTFVRKYVANGVAVSKTVGRLISEN